MIVAWRTVRPAYADAAFSGDGARLYGGRWNRVGTPVVLLASATFDPDDVEDVPPDRLPDDWAHHPASESTAAFGTEWAESGRSIVLRVPSVVLPAESNYVLNPRHPDIGRVTFGAPVPLALDPRLARHQA